MLDQLPLVKLLDPRSELEASNSPIKNSVNIPASEIAARVSELPARCRSVCVANVSGAKLAMMNLEALNRRPQLESTVSYSKFAKARLWSPNEWLEEAVQTIPPGLALDLGCGTGREATWLAAHGWKVTAIDHLPDAIQKARALETRYRLLNSSPVTWKVADVFEELKLQEYSFDLVCTLMFWHPNLLDIAPRYLSVGGRWVGEAFSTSNFEIHGRPGNPLFALDPTLLYSNEKLFQWQSCCEYATDTRTTVRFIGTRIGSPR